MKLKFKYKKKTYKKKHKVSSRKNKTLKNILKGGVKSRVEYIIRPFKIEDTSSKDERESASVSNRRRKRERSSDLDKTTIIPDNKFFYILQIRGTNTYIFILKSKSEKIYDFEMVQDGRFIDLLNSRNDDDIDERVFIMNVSKYIKSLEDQQQSDKTRILTSRDLDELSNGNIKPSSYRSISKKFEPSRKTLFNKLINDAYSFTIQKSSDALQQEEDGQDVEMGQVDEVPVFELPVTESKEEGYFMKAYEDILRERKQLEFALKDVVDKLNSNSVNFSFNKIMEQDHIIHNDARVPKSNISGLVSDISIDTFPELFILESLRDTIHDATRANNYEKSVAFKLYIYNEMYKQLDSLTQKLSVYIEMFDRESHEYNKFIRCLNEFYVIIAYLVMLGPKNLNDAKMKEITYLLENNINCYSLYFTLVNNESRIENADGECRINCKFIPKMLNTPIHKFFDDRQLAFSNSQKEPNLQTNSIITFQKENFKTILLLAHQQINSEMHTGIIDSISNGNVADLSFNIQNRKIKNNLSFFTVDMVPGSGASAEHSLIYNSGSEIGMYPLLGTEWLCRAVDGFTDQANDMHRGSEMRRQKATLNDHMAIRHEYKRQWINVSDEHDVDNRLKLDTCFANHRYFKLESTFSNQPILHYSLYREPFKKELLLPLVYGFEFNSYLRERSQYKAPGSQIKLSCGHAEGYTCACQRNNDSKFNGYFKCKKNGKSSINISKCKEVISSSGSKVRINWCPCHLHTVMKKSYFGCVDKKGNPIENNNLDSELQNLLESKSDWKSLHTIFKNKGLGVCSQYCGCNGLCNGNMVLAQLAMEIMFDATLVDDTTEISKNYDPSEYILNDNVFETYKNEMFALLNLLYNIYFNENISKEKQASLYDRLKEMYDNAYRNKFSEMNSGSENTSSNVDIINSVVKNYFDTHGVSGLVQTFFKFINEYVSNKYRIYLSSDTRWQHINTLLESLSPNRDSATVSSDTQNEDTDMTSSDISISRDNQMTKTLNYFVENEIDILSALQHIQEIILEQSDINNEEKYKENWRNRVLEFYENPMVREAHSDKEEREINIALAKGETRNRKEYPGDSQTHISSITSRYNNTGRTYSGEIPYRGDEALLRAALRKIKYPYEIINLLRPDFSNYTINKIIVSSNIAEDNNLTYKLLHHLITNKEDIVNWIQYSVINKLMRELAIFETSVYSDEICVNCEKIENSVDDLINANEFFRNIYLYSIHESDNSHGQLTRERSDDSTNTNSSDYEPVINLIENNDEFSDINETIEQVILMLINEYGIGITKYIITKTLRDPSHFNKLIVVRYEEQIRIAEEQQTPDSEKKIKHLQEKIDDLSILGQFNINFEYKNKLQKIANNVIENYILELNLTKTNSVNLTLDEIEQKRKSIDDLKKSIKYIENIYNVYNNFSNDIVNSETKETSEILNKFKVIWYDGFIALCLLRLVSDNVIRGADAKGENRKKTARIIFYQLNDDDDSDDDDAENTIMLNHNSSPQPGTSAEVMFRSIEPLLDSKTGVPTNPNLVSDIRNSKFVGDLSQMAIANDFSYKCITGDHVACSCVRFIVPKNKEPFMLFYRSKSQLSPESIYLHLPKLSPPNESYLLNRENDDVTPNFINLSELMQLRADPKNYKLDSSKFLEKYARMTVEQFMNTHNLRNIDNVAIQEENTVLED